MHKIAAVLGLVTITGALQAATLLNPELVNGFYVEAKGSSSFFGGIVDSADVVSSTLNFLGPQVAIGLPPGTVAQGGAGTFGAFSDLSRGLLGAYTAGPPGTTDGHYFEGSDALLMVNLTFNGTGTATFGMHITDSTVPISGPIGGAMFQASISDGGYHFANGAVDQNITFPGQTTGVDWCNGTFVSGGCPDSLNGTPLDLSLTLPIDASHNQYQVWFQLDMRSGGAGAVNAANTAAISLALSPGVGVDLSNGFLSLPQTPEPNYLGGTSAVPEPGSTSLALGAVTLLAAYIRKRSARR
jgi:hypothetical protein